MGSYLWEFPTGIVLTPASDAQPTGSQQRTVAIFPHPQQVTLPIPIEVKERYLEVCEIGTDAVITVLELLSPKNKRPGSGRTAYETKRMMFFQARRISLRLTYYGRVSLYP